MYKVIFNLIDKYDGEILERELICYTECNVNNIKCELEKRYNDEIEIFLIKEEKGFIL